MQKYKVFYCYYSLLLGLVTSVRLFSHLFFWPMYLSWIHAHHRSHLQWRCFTNLTRLYLWTYMYTQSLLLLLLKTLYQHGSIIHTCSFFLTFLDPCIHEYTHHWLYTNCYCWHFTNWVQLVKYTHRRHLTHKHIITCI